MKPTVDLGLWAARLSYIIENSPVSYIIIEPSGRIAYANDAARSSLGSNMSMGINIFSIKAIHGTLLEDKLVSALDGRVETLHRYSHTHTTNGGIRYLNATILPQKIEDKDEVSEILAIISDITDEIRMLSEVESNYLNIVKSLAKALDARDKYTSNHSGNVRKYVEMLAHTLMADHEKIRNIAIAAELHDIGKIGVRDSILNKPEKLTDEELAIMKTHPIIGAELLKDLEGYHSITDSILHHHEFWNGEGYPDGLKGEEIPLGSQIIAIADFFDALTTDRVYRKAIPCEQAFELLSAAKGVQFNPELVDFFISQFKFSLETQPQTKEAEI